MPDSLLSRAELEQLCDTVQPKRMAAWLYTRGWTFEPAGRRGGLPKVLRAHAGVCLANGGRPPTPEPPRRTAEEWAAVLSLAGTSGPWLTPARQESLASIRAETAARKADDAVARAFVAAQAPAIRETRAALIRHHTAKRRAARLRRTPPWANLEAIRAFYVEARRLTVDTGVAHHVDHKVPLQGEFVSGLHVETNLQILTGSENSRKRNRWEPA